MKVRLFSFRGVFAIALILAIGGNMGCTTTYDAYGRPVQSVDPGAAAAGVIAAGALGYAIGEGHDHHHHGHHGHHHYRH